MKSFWVGKHVRLRGIEPDEEGRLRELVYLSGRHHDVLMMGLLADEFAELDSATT
ncbi:hypothetical protein [Streptomyces sp. NPDC049949]|uniref:hypothetical protein n=1 Tax=Streptomyces sp. NPDC049949 TaxID=3154627 RepID=UPI00341E57A5